MMRRGSFSQIGGAIGGGSKAADRKGRLNWCRRPNGFCDLPIWRVVAARLSMPLHQVVAFGNRLEELANDAANVDELRGCVARFNAEEFGVALGMSGEDAARIYAALEHPDVGWISDDHIADFYFRNRDREDDTAADRQRRKRGRKRVFDQLAKLSGRGLIDKEARDAIEAAAIPATLEELRDIETKLARIELDAHLSTDRGVTRDVTVVTRDSRDSEAASGKSSTSVSSQASRLSRVTIVTSRQRRAEQDLSSERDAVENIGRLAPVEPAGWPTIEVRGSVGASQAITEPAESFVPDPETWKATEGLQLVRDRMRITVGQAELKLNEWLRGTGGDVAALAEILYAANASADPQRPSHFLIMVTEAIERRQRAADGPQLPLMTPIAGLKGGAA